MAALLGNPILDKLFEEWDLNGKKIISIDIHIPFDDVIEVKITSRESSGLLKKFTESVKGYTLNKNS